MPMYYISTKPELDGDILIHREDCPNLPMGKKWLGNFDNCEAPVERSRQKNILANGCKECCSECHRQR